MDLLYLLYSLLRRKWIIIGCTVLGLIAGFVFTLFKEKTYGSVAQYSTGFTMEKEVSIKDNAGINIYEIDLRFSNAIETFKSPKVMNMLAYKVLLHDLEDLKPFRTLSEEKKNSNEYKLVNLEQARQILRRKIANMELLNPFDPEEKKVFDLMYLYGYAPEYLQSKLTIFRADRTDYLVILCRSEQPELSAFVANTIGQQFIRFFNSIYGLRSQESAAKLDSLASAKKRTVDSLTAALKEFRDKIGTPNVADRASAAMTVVQGVTSNFQQEQAKLNNLKGELLSVENQLRGLTSPTSDAGSFVNNNAAIRTLELENQNLEIQKNGKSDEEIKKLDDQIEANIKKIAQLKSSGGTTADRQLRQNRTLARQEDLLARKSDLIQQIAAAESNVALFRDQKKYYEEITKTGGGAQVILDAQERDLRIASQEYEQLKKSLQASLDLDINPQNNFKQILVAQPAYMAEPSRRSMVLGLCGMLMLFLSSFIIIALEFFDASFKTPTIFQRTAKLKMLSALNKLNLKKKTLAEHFQDDAVSDNDSAMFIENLRKLRFELAQTGKKIFLVTSTRPKAGKSTVIEALANSLSLTKKRVLLVDANFSNNTLTQKFEAKPALEQFSFTGQGNVMDKFWGITSMTSIPNTDMVGCNGGNYTPSEILPKNNLFEHLPRIAESYDFVLVEAAALNHRADSKELVDWVDGIIAVFSAKSSYAQIDKDSVRYLNSTGDKFVGTVLNNVEAYNMEL